MADLSIQDTCDLNWARVTSDLAELATVVPEQVWHEIAQQYGDEPASEGTLREFASRDDLDPQKRSRHLVTALRTSSRGFHELARYLTKLRQLVKRHGVHAVQLAKVERIINRLLRSCVTVRPHRDVSCHRKYSSFLGWRTPNRRSVNFAFAFDSRLSENSSCRPHSGLLLLAILLPALQRFQPFVFTARV